MTAATNNVCRNS